MPSLHVFNRRTIFSGDDLQPTVWMNSLFRVFQCVLLLIPLVVHNYYEARFFVSQALEKQHNQPDSPTVPYFSYLFGGSIYPNECSTGAHYFPLLQSVYQASTLFHVTISLVFELIIYKIAGLGTPTQPHSRLSLEKVIEKKWIWLSIVGNILVCVFAAMSLNYMNDYSTCRESIEEQKDYYTDNDYLLFGITLWFIVFILLFLSQLLEGIVSAMALGSFLRKEKAFAFITQNYYDMNGPDLDTSVHEHALMGSRYNAHHHELAEEMWSNRCRNFCKCAAFSTCYLFGGRELVDGVVGDYGQISRALADYFEDGGVLDLVPSDLAVGFFMLQRVQRQRVLEARQKIDEEMKQGRDIGDLLRTSSSSTVGSDMHNFSLNHDGRKITSALDDDFNHSQNSSSLFTERVQDDFNYTTSHPMDDMLTSVLHPMPYSRTILLPNDNQSNYDYNGISPKNTSALMLRKKSSRSVNDSRHWYEAQERKVFDPDNEIDRNIIAEGARFARHALSIYTWLLYFYMHPFASIPSLLGSRVKDCFNSANNASDINDFDVQRGDNSCCNTSDPNTNGDNWLHIHKNALLAHSGLDKSDLVYANFSNRYNEMPYCIVIDHKWQSVVVSIRGTLSLEDCVVDVLVDPEPLGDLGDEFGFDASGQYCHSGVVACVKNIMRDLQRHNLLDTLMSGVGAQYAHYKLRFTGHSIGAGCATLLGYIFRQKYPDLRVIAISPPGGFLSWKLATECNEFVTSFVLDSDLVPRLSVSTMHVLRNEVLDLIGRIKVPKMKVAQTFVCNGVCKASKEDDDPEKIAEENASILHPKNEVPTETDFHRQMEKFQEIQRRRREMRGETVKLYPPGKIIHLVKTGEESSIKNHVTKCITCCTSNAGNQYTPVWSNNEDFNELVVSPTMGFDHFPNRVCVELEKCANSFGIDTTIGSTVQDREDGERTRIACQNLL